MAFRHQLKRKLKNIGIVIIGILASPFIIIVGIIYVIGLVIYAAIN